MDFETLKAECLACHRCGLCETRKNVVFGQGVPNAEVMFVGEGPGANEDEQGLPFVGRSGKLLDSYLEAIDMDRNRNIFTFVTNIQDETHRYANDYRKRAMKKRAYAATLTALPGVGEKTSAALLAHFKTVAAVRAASISDLEEVKGISHAKAETIYNALRQGV